MHYVFNIIPFVVAIMHLVSGKDIDSNFWLDRLCLL